MIRHFSLASIAVLLLSMPSAASTIGPMGATLAGANRATGWASTMPATTSPRRPTIPSIRPSITASRSRLGLTGPAPCLAGWTVTITYVPQGELTGPSPAMIRNPYVRPKAATSTTDLNVTKDLDVTKAAVEPETTENPFVAARSAVGRTPSAERRSPNRPWKNRVAQGSVLRHSSRPHAALPMLRILLVVTAAAAIAGCPVQDPFAAFGPPRVPGARKAQSTPSYPTTAAATNPADAAESRNGAAAGEQSASMSVSADDKKQTPAASTRFASDPADRQPIRIVENPSAGTRTATAPSHPATESP